MLSHTRSTWKWQRGSAQIKTENSNNGHRADLMLWCWKNTPINNNTDKKSRTMYKPNEHRCWASIHNANNKSVPLVFTHIHTQHLSNDFSRPLRSSLFLHTQQQQPQPQPQQQKAKWEEGEKVKRHHHHKQNWPKSNDRSKFFRVRRIERACVRWNGKQKWWK